MKKLLIATLVVMLIVTGCKKVPKLENEQEMVASLNKDGISVDDLYEEMKSQYALGVLINMVDEKILSEKYETTSAEKDYIQNQKENDLTFYNLYYSGVYQTYESYLKARYNYSSATELDNYFKIQYRKDLVTKEYAENLVTEGEIKDYYEDDFIPEMEASHILITAEYPKDADETVKAKAEADALKTAKEVIEKLNKGENFADLAKEYSKDKGSAAKGGAIGKFGNGGMAPEFESAAYKLKVNEYTKEPVKTQYGYHIILKTKEYEKKPLEEVKDEIKVTLGEQKVSSDETISEKALIKLREDNGLKIEDSTLKTQYENYKYQYE